jgi:hypothetical protein
MFDESLEQSMCVFFNVTFLVDGVRTLARKQVVNVKERGTRLGR